MKMMFILMITFSLAASAKLDSKRKPNSQNNFPEFIEAVFPKNKNLGKQIPTNKEDLKVYEIVDIEAAKKNLKNIKGDKIDCNSDAAVKYDWAQDKKTVDLKYEKSVGSIITFILHLATEFVSLIPLMLLHL